MKKLLQIGCLLSCIYTSIFAMDRSFENAYLTPEELATNEKALLEQLKTFLTISQAAELAKKTEMQAAYREIIPPEKMHDQLYSKYDQEYQKEIAEIEQAYQEKIDRAKKQFFDTKNAILAQHKQKKQSQQKEADRIERRDDDDSDMSSINTVIYREPQ